MQFVNHVGLIQFRHPLVMDGKYGKVVRKSIGRLPSREQAAIDDDLVWLHEVKLRKRGDVKGRTLHPKAANMWFKPIEAADRDRELADKARNNGFPVPPSENETQKNYWLSRSEASLTESEQIKVERWKREDAEKKAKDAERREAAAIRARDEMADKLGQSVLQKEGISLSQCLSHFEKEVKCSSEDAKAPLMTRIKAVVEQLGPNTPHGVITLNKILHAVDASTDSPPERRVRRYSIKRFFRLLSAPPSSNGLGLPNPTVMLKVGSAAALQRQRREEGLVETLDPAELLTNKNLDMYWKALIALCGYAGLRLGEAAAMEWDRIGQPGELIEVRPTEHYPKLKSFLSNRDVPPFPNVHPVLDAYKKNSRHKSLLFDREGKAGPTWFHMYRGRPTAADLSGALIDAIGAATGMKYTLKDGTVYNVKSHSRRRDEAGVDTLYLHLVSGERAVVPRSDVVSMDRPREPALRLRHFWETQMRKAGLEDLIKYTGGHDPKTGFDYYTKQREIVAAAAPKIPTLPTIVQDIAATKTKKKTKSGNRHR